MFNGNIVACICSNIVRLGCLSFSALGSNLGVRGFRRMCGVRVYGVIKWRGITTKASNDQIARTLLAHVQSVVVAGRPRGRHALTCATKLF